MSDQNNKKLLDITVAEQYHTVDELIEESQPSHMYYTLLVLSTLVIASGILLSNAPVVIGGMLITPVLTPILVIALGLATGEVNAVTRQIWLIVKSFLVVVAGSFILGLIFGVQSDIAIFENSARTAILFFVIATGSGVAATFAWANKKMAVALPGVAIAVSLVPPLSLVGIGFAGGGLDLVRFSFFIVIFNLLGIIIGSLVVFSLLKFHRVEGELQQKSAEVQKQDGDEEFPQ